MDLGITFRRIHGHIVPIVRKAAESATKAAKLTVEKYPAASGFALLGGSAYAGYKTRQQFSKRVLGRKSGGTGSVAANFVADVGLSSGYLYGASKVLGHHSHVALSAAYKVMRGGR